MKTNIKILVMILITFCTISCKEVKNRKIYHEKGNNNYYYQDDNLLCHYFIYSQITGIYNETTTSTTPETLNDVTTTTSFEAVQTSEMTETTGQDIGGSDNGNESSGEGMSESGGSDSGGSDSSGGGELLYIR